MEKRLRLIALLLAMVNSVYSQVTIKGRVIDATTNQPVQGVTVSDQSNQHSTTTDKNGNFVFNGITHQDSILFTSIGYNPKNIPVSENDLFVTLIPSFANLNEIIVSGSREAQRRTEVPVAVTVISKSAINETKATRLDMLINKVPGVFMVDLGNEQHSMSARQPLGYGNLFLYLEDGIPIRTVGDFNHNALIEINQASVERIEMIKGPASSLYGSEAVGGAINFITQAPSPFLSGRIQAETGSQGYKRTDFNVSNTYKKLGIYAGGYYASQDQPAELHNDFNKAALALRADYAFNNKTKLVTVADYIQYKTDGKGGLDSAHFYNRDYISFYRFTYRKVDALRMRSTLTKSWNENNKTNITAFYRNSNIGQNPHYRISDISGNASRAKGQINEDAFHSYGAIIQHSKKIISINAKWITGVSIDYSPAEYFAKYIDIDKDNEGIYTNYIVRDSLLTNYHVDLLNTAVYTQFEYSPANTLKLIGALRYDRLDYTFNNHLPPGAYSGAPDASDHFDHFSPKLGLTYNFGRNRGVYANYSMGFAPPNITDLYTGVKVPSLQPASYNNYEVGGWVSFSGTKGYAEFSLYKLDGKNEIVSVRQADGTSINQNAGITSHKGIEMNIRYAPVEDLRFRIGGTYAEHKYIEYIQQGKDFSGNKMSQAPPYIVNGEIIYKPHYFKGFRISLEYQGMAKYFKDPENTTKYEGFTVFNARTGYTFSRFELWLNCLNLFDKVYATTVEKSAYGTSYRPGQLRTFNIGIAVNINKQIMNGKNSK